MASKQPSASACTISNRKLLDNMMCVANARSRYDVKMKNWVLRTVQSKVVGKNPVGPAIPYNMARLARIAA